MNIDRLFPQGISQHQKDHIVLMCTVLVVVSYALGKGLEPYVDVAFSDKALPIATAVFLWFTIWAIGRIIGFSTMTMHFVGIALASNFFSMSTLGMHMLGALAAAIILGVATATVIITIAHHPPIQRLIWSTTRKAAPRAATIFCKFK